VCVFLHSEKWQDLSVPNFFSEFRRKHLFITTCIEKHCTHHLPVAMPLAECSKAIFPCKDCCSFNPEYVSIAQLKGCLLDYFDWELINYLCLHIDAWLAHLSGDVKWCDKSTSRKRNKKPYSCFEDYFIICMNFLFRQNNLSVYHLTYQQS